MAKARLIILSVFLSLIFPSVIFAESVTLKSGRKIEGKILERAPGYIKIEINGSPVYYEPKYIKSIENDSTPIIPPQEEPPLRDATFYLKEGFRYASAARFQEAESAFKKGLAIKSADHNLKEALKMTEDLKAGLINEEYALHLFKGSDCLINARYEQAVPEFKEALRLTPDNADLYYYIGLCHYSLEQYPEAISYLKKAEERKQDEEIYYYLGVSNYSLGRYPEAISYLEKAIALNPGDAESYSLIGTIHLLLGLAQQGKDSLNKAKVLFQDNGDYLKAKEIEDFLSRLD